MGSSYIVREGRVCTGELKCGEWQNIHSATINVYWAEGSGRCIASSVNPLFCIPRVVITPIRGVQLDQLEIRTVSCKRIFAFRTDDSGRVWTRIYAVELTYEFNDECLELPGRIYLGDFLGIASATSYAQWQAQQEEWQEDQLAEQEKEIAERRAKHLAMLKEICAKVRGTGHWSEVCRWARRKKGASFIRAANALEYEGRPLPQEHKEEARKVVLTFLGTTKKKAPA